MNSLQITYDGYFKLPQYGGGQQFTFNGSNGPLCLMPSGDILIGGHALWPEYHAVKIPDILDGRRTVGTGSWIDPCYGKIATLPTSTPSTHNYKRGICWPKGQNRVDGTVNQFYNVTNSVDGSHFSSDLVGGFGGFWKTTQPRIRTAGYICELPPAVQAATGHRLGFGESIPQGTNATNSGPALSTCPIPDNNLAPFSTIAETARYTHYAPDKYKYFDGIRSWSGICRCDGIGSTADCCVWFGRTATRNSVEWYDGNPNLTFASFPIKTFSFPADAKGVRIDGQIVVNDVLYDEVANHSKGYHCAEVNGVRGYRPVIFYSYWSDILAGVRKIYEIDLSQWITNKSGIIFGCTDYETNKAYILEYDKESGNMPFIHRFSLQTEDPIMIAELQQQLAAEKADNQSLRDANVLLNAQAYDLNKGLTDSRNRLLTLNSEIDIAQAKANL